VSLQISSGGGFPVNGRVGRILELLRDERLGKLPGQLLRLFDGAAHPQGAGGQDQLGPVGLQEIPALDAHGVRHHQDHLVALGGRGKGQGDAGVAAGGLDDHGVLVELAFPLRRLEHGEPDAVLDAPGRVEVLQLAVDLGAGLVGDPVEAEQRRVPDQLCDGSCDFAQRF